MDELIYEGDFIAKDHILNKDYFDENGNCILTEITGYADFRGWEGNANNLTTIGGTADFEGWKGGADNLTTIGGNVDFEYWQGSAPLLNNKYIFSSPIGSRDANCKFDRETKQYFTGCFSGNEEELIKAIKSNHEKDSIHYNQYMEFVNKCSTYR